MKNMKQWLCLLLAMLMVVGMMAMASCADESEQTPDDEQTPADGETTDDPAEVQANLEALNRCKCYAQAIVKTIVYLSLLVTLAIYDNCIGRYHIVELVRC